MLRLNAHGSPAFWPTTADGAAASKAKSTVEQNIVPDSGKDSRARKVAVETWICRAPLTNSYTPVPGVSGYM